MMLMFERAGLDSDLAEALYRLDFDPANHPLYPGVLATMEAIKAKSVKVAVVSDVHFDLRSELTNQGLGDLIDPYVLSFEHGFQKPDPRMFTTALDLLRTKPNEALMVGDRITHDGGAVSVGIATLILPVLNELAPRGLDVVLGLVG